MTEIGLCRISLSGWNPRKSFEPEAFEELKKSIQQHGILEPLIVRPISNSYELVAGERRYRAAKEIGLELVPVVIKNLSDRDVREIMLIENLQRCSLEPLEEAAALEILLQDGVTQEELGKKLGKSQSWVANRLRLLKAPDELKVMMISQQISPKHALTLLPVAKYPPLFEDVLVDMKARICDNGQISVKELDEILDDIVSSAEYTLNIDSLPWEKKKLNDFFDRSGCDGCKDTVPIKGYNENEERHCLKVECWSHKLAEAEKKYDKAKAEEHKKLEKKQVVNTAKMEYGTYRRHHSTDGWDKTACNACDKCKKDKFNDLICLDPVCYDKRERAWNKEKNKKAREDDKLVWAAMDEKLSCIKELGENEFRFLAMGLARNIIWSQAVKKAFRPWEHFTKKGHELPAIKDIPAEDLPKLLLRFIIVQRMNGGNGLATMKQFNEAVEGLGV